MFYLLDFLCYIFPVQIIAKDMDKGHGKSKLCSFFSVGGATALYNIIIISVVVNKGLSFTRIARSIMTASHERLPHNDY